MTEPDKKRCGDGDKGGDPTDLGGLSHLEERRSDESHNSRSDTFEGRLDSRYFFPVLEDHRDREDDKE
jgi:hypothetical protein